MAGTDIVQVEFEGRHQLVDVYTLVDARRTAAQIVRRPTLVDRLRVRRYTRWNWETLSSRGHNENGAALEPEHWFREEQELTLLAAQTLVPGLHLMESYANSPAHQAGRAERPDE